MSSTKKDKTVKKNTSSVFLKFGAILIFLGIAIFILTFYRLIFSELKYWFARPNNDAQVALKRVNTPKNTLTPVDENFGIVIPKIAANAKVVPNVSYTNEKEYQWQLTKGVAHAKGTAMPGGWGNTFIFAHSAGNFYDANRYNAIFYLLNKLEKDDKIIIVYKKQKFVYKMTDKKIVAPDDVKYLLGDSKKQTLTLMTCWPAGTTLKRLLIIGELTEGAI